MLSVILLCGARTFLTAGPFGMLPRDRSGRSVEVIIAYIKAFVNPNFLYFDVDYFQNQIYN